MRVMDFFTMFFAAVRMGSLLGALMVIFAALVILRGMKDKAALVLLLGGILATLGPMSAVAGSVFLARFWGPESLRLVNLVTGSVAPLGWFLVGLGMLMLAPVVAGLARRNRELEAVMAERRE